MAQRIGFWSIRKFAYGTCKYIAIFGPIIKLTYPDNTTLHAVLDLAATVCADLVAEIDAQAPVGV